MRISSSLLRPRFAASIVAASFAFTGCTGGALSPEQARTATVAEVPGGTLKGATLERWLLKLPAAPTDVAASVLVSTWINTALMIDALRNNRPLDDSATVDAVIRPDAERGVSMAYFAQRNAGRPPVTDAETDSLADIDRVRVFQQILFRTPPNADSATRIAVINRAKVVLKRAQDGADFGALAIEASPDSATRSNRGFLPAITRDQVSRLPQRMQQIWMLKPGDIANLIGSPIGVHIMRRATRMESRPRLKEFLGPILARRADSLFIDSVARARRIVVAPDARARVRALAREPVVASDSSPMATWRDGALTPAMVRSAALMLDPAQRVRLSNASDSTITSYLIELAKRRIILGVVAPGPSPSPQARSALAPSYRTAISTLRASMSQLPTTLNAGDAATQYLDSALVGQHPLALPGALSELLRSGARVRVDSVALESVLRTVAPEWRVQHANDSTPVRPGTTAGGVRPAGPPPQ